MCNISLSMVVSISLNFVNQQTQCQLSFNKRQKKMKKKFQQWELYYMLIRFRYSGVFCRFNCIHTHSLEISFAFHFTSRQAYIICESDVIDTYHLNPTLYARIRTHKYNIYYMPHINWWQMGATLYWRQEGGKVGIITNSMRA